MTARVCYTADALYPEYKTARLETFGEDMTNQKRRIEDKLPTEPLDWTEAEDAAWQELAAGAVNAGITSEENGAGDLTDEQIGQLYREAQDQSTSGISPSLYFARAIERAAIAAHLARQPKAEQPVIKTWQERMVGNTFRADVGGVAKIYIGDRAPLEARNAEIADLRAHLARQAQEGSGK
jgi:hypothetical protein